MYAWFCQRDSAKSKVNPNHIMSLCYLSLLFKYLKHFCRITIKSIPHTAAPVCSKAEKNNRIITISIFQSGCCTSKCYLSSETGFSSLCLSNALKTVSVLVCVLPGGPVGPRGPWLPTPGFPLSPFSPGRPEKTQSPKRSSLRWKSHLTVAILGACIAPRGCIRDLPALLSIPVSESH